MISEKDSDCDVIADVGFLHDVRLMRGEEGVEDDVLLGAEDEDFLFVFHDMTLSLRDCLAMFEWCPFSS